MANKLKLTEDEYNNLVEILNNHDLDMFDILREINNNYDHKLDELSCDLFGNETCELDREAQIEFIKDPLSYIEVEKKKYYVHLIKDSNQGYLNVCLNDGEISLCDNSQAFGYQTQFTKDELNNMKNIAFTINNDALEEVEDGK